MTPDWRPLLQSFTRIGLLSFGGPAAQIAVMHRELVDTRGWIGERQFLNALSFCMLLPGPEAMQLATYSGWRLRGVAGGLLAGALFVLPGALVMGLLAAAYATWGRVPAVEALFLGVKATVIVVVIQALLRLGRKTLNGWINRGLAVLSFLGLFLFDLPFPAVVVSAALIGALTASAPVDSGDRPAPAPARTLRTVATWLVLWWAPVALAWAAGAERLTQIGLFFSKLAVVTFGGAYAVLAYMTQEVVSDQGWLTTAQMMDGLGLAETTPGPLILVTEFVGFLAGFGAGGWGIAVLGAAMTIWVTFIPCFLWIFAAAPFVEQIATRPRLTGALSAITAAVVGVVANLSLWFAFHVFFAEVARVRIGPAAPALPAPASFDPAAAGLAGLAALLLLWRNAPLVPVLVLMALAGLGLGALGA